MTTASNIPRPALGATPEEQEALFSDILDEGEEILWFEKPVYLLFVLTGVPFLIFGLIWGYIDYQIILFAQELDSKVFLNFLYIFLILHAFPCWVSVLNIFYLIFGHKNVAYILTNRRLIKRSGIFGIDYKSIDHDRIVDLNISVNPLENLYKVGTISAYSGNSTRKGHKIHDKFVAIKNPYKVYKQMKSVSLDVKTDWNFPNDLRPEGNSGYKTKYSPNSKE